MDLIDQMRAIPHGLDVKIQWAHDDWPCVFVTLSRYYGKVAFEGRGDGADLGQALHDALADAVSQAEDADRP